MNPFWKRLTGLTVADRYQLKQVVASDEAGAFFLASAGAEEFVVIKLVPEDADQLALWERVRQLSHPHLQRLVDCGPAEVDGEAFVYAAFENFDDNAAAALQSGPMTAEETREALKASAAALAYLHENGMVHAAVAPEQMLAVGDEIKLARDTVREASPRVSPQNDVWDLGAAIYELLTRRRIRQGDQLDLAAIEEPFRSIVQQALTGSATPEGMVAALDPPPVVEAQSAIVEAPPPEPVAPLASVAPPEPIPVHRPAPPARTPVPRWAYPAAGLIIAAGAWIAMHRSDPEPQAMVPIAPAAAPITRPAPAIDRPEPPPRTRSEERPFWRVIAYTYSRLTDAQEKAERINQRRPELRATVFTPRGADRAPYLVSLGGRMSRDEALRVQRRARAAGMPRDTFVRNYSD